MSAEGGRTIICFEVLLKAILPHAPPTPRSTQSTQSARVRSLNRLIALVRFSLEGRVREVEVSTHHLNTCLRRDLTSFATDWLQSAVSKPYHFSRVRIMTFVKDCERCCSSRHLSHIRRPALSGSLQLVPKRSCSSRRATQMNE